MFTPKKDNLLTYSIQNWSSVDRSGRHKASCVLDIANEKIDHYDYRLKFTKSKSTSIKN
jgi:hypothetical protein